MEEVFVAWAFGLAAAEEQICVLQLFSEVVCVVDVVVEAVASLVVEEGEEEACVIHSLHLTFLHASFLM